MSSTRALVRLTPIASGHPAARRFVLARRNALPRGDLVIPVVGLWAHEQALRLGASLQEALWCPGDGLASLDDRFGSVVARVCAEAEQAFEISARTLARLSPGSQAPGLVSLARLPHWTPAEVFGGARRILVADGIEYAGNLGTLLRTVDASGTDAMILTDPVARRTHPSVFSASRGTVLTTPVLEYDDAARARNALVSHGYRILVADPDCARDYRDVCCGSDKVAIVVGSEGSGVGPAWRSEDVERISITMHGRADSLNVAAAAAILLFAVQAGPRRR